MFIDKLVLKSFFCSSNFQFSYSQIDKVTYVTICYKLTPMLTVCKHLLFDAPWIGTYDRVYLKEFGMEQVNTQLAVKILFDDYSVFLWDEDDNYFTRKAEIIIDTVYDLDEDWFRIFTLERAIY